MSRGVWAGEWGRRRGEGEGKEYGWEEREGAGAEGIGVAHILCNVMGDRRPSQWVWCCSTQHSTYCSRGCCRPIGTRYSSFLCCPPSPPPPPSSGSCPPRPLQDPPASAASSLARSSGGGAAAAPPAAAFAAATAALSASRAPGHRKLLSHTWGGGGRGGRRGTRLRVGFV